MIIVYILLIFDQIENTPFIGGLAPTFIREIHASFSFLIVVVSKVLLQTPKAEIIKNRTPFSACLL